MPSQITLPACFAITGHGRSGTSLVAAMLQSAGLEIGERLMGPSDANKYGHYEDLDFYEFHVSVLLRRASMKRGSFWNQACPFPISCAPARNLIARRMRTAGAWGWKEPRTTLFLNFWQQLIPQLNCILLFRAPWEVADSLFRRGDANFLKNPNMAVRVWLNYNHAVLAYHNRHSERCLLVESFAVREPGRLLEAVAQKFGHHFGPIGELYDEQIYSHHTSPQHQAVLAHWFPEAVELYEQLRAKADVAVQQELLPPTRAFAPGGLGALSIGLIAGSPNGNSNSAERNWSVKARSFSNCGPWFRSHAPPAGKTAPSCIRFAPKPNNFMRS